jgi:predicted metal-dependent RNase
MPKQIFVVHGEPSASFELRDRLEEATGAVVVVPTRLERVRLV